MRTASCALVVAGAVLALALGPSAAGAACCQYSGACSGADVPSACGGTFFPDPATCEPDGSCSSVSVTTTTLPTPGWPGFADGRLNPDPGEYYAVWCAYDVIDVYRAVPTYEQLKVIPLLDAISLAVGASLALGDSMSLERSSEDTVTIDGSNGNMAPEFGSKAFSLSECIDRNGGPPDAPPPSGPERGQPPTPEEEMQWKSEEEKAREHEETVERCFSLYPDDVELLIDCLDFAESSYKTIGVCWLPIFRFRADASSAALPGALVTSRRHHGAVRRPAWPGGAAGPSAGGFDFLDTYLQLTLLRDRVLAATLGGRRATALYYASNPAIVASAIANPTVLTAGRDALEAWAPVVEGLVRGDGTGPVVTAAQVEAFEAFLTEVRAGADPELRVSLEREALLLDPASFVGLAPGELLARLDELGCEATLDVVSLRCRLGDLSRIVDDRVERKIRKRLAPRLAKAAKQAMRAEAAEEGSRRRRKALLRTARLLRAVERRLGKKKVIARVPEPVRLVLGTDAAALRADAQTLAGTTPAQ